MTFKKNWMLTALFALGLVLTMAATSVAEVSQISELRFWSAPGYTRVVVELEGGANFAVNRLKNPDRIYIDIHNATMTGDVRKIIGVEDGLVQRIRTGQYSSDTVRVVLDLENLKEYKVFRLSHPNRIVMDIFKLADAPPVTTYYTMNEPAPKPAQRMELPVVKAETPDVIGSAVQTAKAEPLQSIQNAPDTDKADAAAQDAEPAEPVVSTKAASGIAPAVIQAVPPPKFARKRIVIDAGHGGKDPGAIGPDNLMEKDVVLDIARRLKRDLEARGGYEVVLTRDNDTYLDLEQRTLVANKKDADLFISVHANANNIESLSGMETYMLNYTDEESALKVAARENKISLRRMKQARSEVGIMLASLEMDIKRDMSIKLANYVQDSMVQRTNEKFKNIQNHGVKQALFYVLFGARMPSVLVEVSYITNKAEAKRLRTSAYKQQIATGIADGIETYFRKTDTIQKIALR